MRVSGYSTNTMRKAQIVANPTTAPGVRPWACPTMAPPTAITRSLRRNRQRAGDAAAQCNGRAHRELLVVPWISDIGFERDSPEVDVVAEGVPQVRAEGDLAAEAIPLTRLRSVEREILGTDADEAAL